MGETVDLPGLHAKLSSDSIISMMNNSLRQVSSPAALIDYLKMQGERVFLVVNQECLGFCVLSEPTHHEFLISNLCQNALFTVELLVWDADESPVAGYEIGFIQHPGHFPYSLSKLGGELPRLNQICKQFLKAKARLVNGC